jgi:hypothetical protein
VSKPDRPETANEFGGVATDVFPVSMPPGLYQEDQGGDRYFRGSWRRRLGMIRTNLDKYDAAVTSILGFEMAGDDFAVITVEGTNVHGNLNVTEQDYTVAASASGEGLGETEFGEGMGE